MAPGVGAQAMRRWRPVVGALVRVGALVLVGACTTDPPTEPLIPVFRVAITGAPADNVVLIDRTIQLDAAALGPGDEPLPDRDIAWSSLATDIATVDGDGRVDTHALGSVDIRATSDGVTGVLPLSVREGTTVPGQGNTRFVTLLGGKLHLAIRVGSAPGGTVVHVREAVTWPANERIIPGTVVEIGPLGTQFAEPMTTGVSFVPTEIPAAERDQLRLFGVDASGEWVELPQPNVDLNDFIVEADLMRLTTVAIFRPTLTP